VVVDPAVLAIPTAGGAMAGCESLKPAGGRPRGAKRLSDQAAPRVAWPLDCFGGLGLARGRRRWERPD